MLEIDWQGAAQVRRLIPDSVHVFILPPSLAVLKERLEMRGQDAPGVIARRLDGARDEMRHWAEFDYVIINQDFATAVDDVTAIVRAARLQGHAAGRASRAPDAGTSRVPRSLTCKDAPWPASPSRTAWTGFRTASN